MEKPVVTILCRTGGESQKRKFPLDYPPGIWYYIRCIQYAPVAQLDRASDSDSEGRAFEPHRAYQSRHGFHGGIFLRQSNKQQNRPEPLPSQTLFIYYRMVVCIYRTKRQIAKRHSGFFEGAF